MELIELWTICSANNIVLSKEQIKQIERYCNELVYWNEKVNLISRKDYEQLIEKHILHSLSLLKYLDIRQKARVLDVGTGGGLPGIPLKIARPDLFITLIDSIKKKVKIVEMFGKHTELRNIQAITSRAEELFKKKGMENNFDLVVSRAVAKTTNVIAWVKKLVKPGASLVLYKGGDLEEEIRNAENEHNNISIYAENIEMIGVDSFKKDEKKLVFCKFLD